MSVEADGTGQCWFFGPVSCLWYYGVFSAAYLAWFILTFLERGRERARGRRGGRRAERDGVNGFDEKK